MEPIMFAWTGRLCWPGYGCFKPPLNACLQTEKQPVHRGWGEWASYGGHLDRVAMEMTPPPITMPPTTEASERDVEMECSSEVCVCSHVHITLPIML